LGSGRTYKALYYKMWRRKADARRSVVAPEMEHEAPGVRCKPDGDCNKAREIPPRGGNLIPTEARPKPGDSPWQKDLNHQHDDRPNEGNCPPQKDQLAATFAFWEFRFYHPDLSRKQH